MLPALLLASGVTMLAMAREAEGRVMRTITSAPPYRVTGPLVSVVIPTYNEEKRLPDLLAALPNQTYDNIEVIVVDNMSEDDTVEIARAYGATVIETDIYNISRSRNIGAARAAGEILAFIDADSIPEASAIERAVANIQDGCPLVCVNTCATDSFPYSVMRIAYGFVSTPPSHGSFAALSRDTFEAVGGFDEELFAQRGQGEDLDLGARVRARFGRTCYLRDVFVGTSARRQLKQGLLGPVFQYDRAIRGRFPRLS